MFTADDYQAITTGVGFNLNQFGSLSFDVTGAEQSFCNNRIAINYAAIVIGSTTQNISNQLGSQITFAGYRFSDKDYVSMSEYLASRNGDETVDNEKESYVISLNQYFAALELNSYLNITRNTYWDRESNTNYSLSLSRNFDIGDFRGISASLAISRIRWDDDEENQYYFSFSLPLQQNRNISYSMQRTGDSNTSQMISWYDTSDRNEYLEYFSIGNRRQYPRWRANTARKLSALFSVGTPEYQR